MLTRLTLTLSLSSYFCLQQQRLISLVGKMGFFGFVIVFSLSGKYMFIPQLLLTMVFSTSETLWFPGRVPYAVCLPVLFGHLPQKPKLSFQTPTQVPQSFKEAGAIVQILDGFPSQMSLPAPLM